MSSSQFLNGSLITRGPIQAFSSLSAFDPIIINSNNTHGGSDYAGLMTLTNSITGTENPNKFVRMNNIGSLEILNSGYTGTLLSLKDSGELNIQGSLYAVPNYCTAGLPTNQTMSNSDTAVQFTAISDLNGWWKTSGSPAYRFQPTRSGVYVITYSVSWGTGGGSDQINTQISKNGNQVLIYQSQVNTVVPLTHANTAIISLNGTTDYIQITCFSGSTTTQIVNGGAGKTTTTFNAYLLN
jgi:hypothetical protein